MHWSIFAVLLAVIIVMWTPFTVRVSMWLWKPDQSTSPRDSNVFAALVYEGVSNKPNEVSPALFQEHLDALRVAGYVPIDLNDARDLLRAGKPVPRKAVLLTLDHCRKSSYYATRGPLRKAGWNAVMFLWTKPIEEEDPACVLWPYVRNMVESQRWQVGAQSHAGVGTVQRNAAGDTGNFMTTRQWLADQNRMETDVEFRNRLASDHDTCIDLIRNKAGSRATAYAYPYGDFGQYHRRDELVRGTNMQLVGERYDLGFLSGSPVINTRFSDRRRLNRLRVKPSWSGRELVEYIDKCWPVENARHHIRAHTPSGCFVDGGNLHFVGRQPVLAAKEDTTGARAWLAGSDLVGDFHLRTAVTILSNSGQVSFYLRATPDEEMYISLTVDVDGGIWLRQKQPGLDPFTLGSVHRKVVPGERYPVDIIMRGNRMCVFFDEEPVFGGRVALRGRTRPGALGVSVWDSVRGNASVKLDGLAVVDQTPVIASWDLGEEMEPYVVRWIHQNAFRISGISPPWLDVAANGEVIRRTHLQSPLFGKLSDIYGFNVTPEVRLVRDHDLVNLDPEQLAQDVEDMRMDGICVNLSGVAAPSVSGIESWVQKACTACGEKGQSVFVRLPDVLQYRAGLRSVLTAIPMAQIVAPAGSRMFLAAESAGDVVALKEVPPLEAGAPLPTYVQIADASTNILQQSDEAKALRFERDGHAAFTANDYRGAIEVWGKWRRIDPHNPRPLMLMGDAHSRCGEADAALQCYDRSLDLDPGQVKLAIRRVELLQSIGRSDDARESLNLYARLFPHDDRIMRAQAEWLRRRGRNEEARVLAREIVARSPDDVEMLVFLLSVSQSQEDRSRVIGDFARLAADKAMHYVLIDAIRRHQLLSLSDSQTFVAIVEMLVRESSDERVVAMATNLRPPLRVVDECFGSDGLSDVWRVAGGTTACEEGALHMGVMPNRKEAYLQMQGSERLKEAFVEATITALSGSFWLYSRRSPDHYVRFGIDESTERVHLQVWRRGRIVSQSSVSWQSSKSTFRMRLETRRSGAIAYLDGQCLFPAPEAIPDDLGFGWTGASVWSLDVGRAEVKLASLSAGPLPLRLALLPAVTSEKMMDDMIAALRPGVRHMSAICPRWYSVNAQGEWQSSGDKDDRLLRLFAKYNRTLLLPVVDVPAGVAVRVDELLSACESGNGNGVIVNFEVMPSGDALDELEDGLRMKAAMVIAIAMGGEKTAEIRCLGAARDFLPGTDGLQQIHIEAGSAPESDSAAAAVPAIVRF